MERIVESVKTTIGFPLLSSATAHLERSAANTMSHDERSIESWMRRAHSAMQGRL